MATKLETVIQHALRTFGNPRRIFSGCLTSDLNELKRLTDQITANDVGCLRGLLNSEELKEFLKTKKTSLDYLPVHEDDRITVGVFLLGQGAKLPIHDHPDMYGIIKVLQGILKVTSYSPSCVDSTSSPVAPSMFYSYPLIVRKHPEVRLSNKDECCLLTPTDRNIHEVECVEGPAAFLDILSPPYEEGGSYEARTCHYFRELNSDLDPETSMKLIQVASPF